MWFLDLTTHSHCKVLSNNTHVKGSTKIVNHNSMLGQTIGFTDPRKVDAGVDITELPRTAGTYSN